jgi:hypothetical protein
MWEQVLVVAVTLAVFAASYWRICQMSSRRQGQVAAALFSLAVISLTSIYFFCFVQTERGTLGYISAFFHALYGALIAVVQVSNDYAEASPILAGYPVVRMLFWASLLVATYAFVLAIVAIFGRRALDFLRWRFSRGASLYLIVGVGPNTVSLGESIARIGRDGAGGGRRRLIKYLATGQDAPTDGLSEQVRGFGGIIQDYSETAFARAFADLSAQGRGGKTKNHLVIAPGHALAAIRVLEAVEKAAEKAIEGAAKGHRDQRPFPGAADNLHIHVQIDSPVVATKVDALPPHLNLAGFDRSELLARAFVLDFPPHACLEFDGLRATGDFHVVMVGLNRFAQTLLDQLVMNGRFLGSTMRVSVLGPDADALLEQYQRRRPDIGRSVSMDALVMDTRRAGYYAFLRDHSSTLSMVILSESEQANGNDGPEDGRGKSPELLYAETLDVLKQSLTAGALRRLVVAAQISEGMIVCKNGNERILDCARTVFTADVLIRETIDERARIVNYVYQHMDVEGLVGGVCELPFPDREALSRAWHKLPDRFTERSNRATAQFLETLAYLACGDALYDDQSRPIAQDPAMLRLLAECEHMRWEAFHYTQGWRSMSLEEMRRHCLSQAASGRAAAGFQKDSKRRMHACLVPFDELSRVSACYNELLAEFNPQGTPRYFEHEDEKIIRCIEWINRCTRQGHQGSTD